MLLTCANIENFVFFAPEHLLLPGHGLHGGKGKHQGPGVSRTSLSQTEAEAEVEMSPRFQVLLMKLTGLVHGT